MLKGLYFHREAILLFFFFFKSNIQASNSKDLYGCKEKRWTQYEENPSTIHKLPLNLGKQKIACPDRREDHLTACISSGKKFSYTLDVTKEW